jgi:hypothetical protein
MICVGRLFRIKLGHKREKWAKANMRYKYSWKILSSFTLLGVLGASLVAAPG